MAKIQEQVVLIRLSKLLKGDQKQSATITDGDFAATIEEVVGQLVDPSVIVEVVMDDIDGPADH